MDYIITIIRVLFLELAGVGICTAVLYLYWNLMSHKIK